MKRMKRLSFPAVVLAALWIWLPACSAEEKPRACVIDLDGTVADETTRREAAAGEDGKLQGAEYNDYFLPERVSWDKPIHGSREVLERIREKGVQIVYVSSRPASLLAASREWLGKHGFPEAPVHHKEEKYERSVKYKTRTIRGLQEKYDVLFGVGDRDSDMEAYGNCGIVAIRVDPEKAGEWKRVEEEVGRILEKEPAPAS
jgi:predicted secreted acid phosphatase